jgi:hypothetical protein
LDIKVSITSESDKLLFLLNGYAEDLKKEIYTHLKNVEPTLGALEYGTGMFTDNPESSKGYIRPIKAKALLIPIFATKQIKLMNSNLKNKKNNVNRKKVTSITEEAKYNANRYPDVYARVKKGYPSCIGFIFRAWSKGQKPQRIVRDSKKEFKQIFQKNWNEMEIYNIEKFKHWMNKSTEEFLEHLIYKTPYLSGKSKRGWRFVKKA